MSGWPGFLNFSDDCIAVRREEKMTADRKTQKVKEGGRWSRKVRKEKERMCAVVD